MSETSEYDKGFEHGAAMRLTDRPFHRQAVVDNPTDPFFQGYNDGWQSTDRKLRTSL